jgi:hypothetical protein
MSIRGNPPAIGVAASGLATPANPALTRPAIVLGLALTTSSGLAILAHAFAGLSMAFTVPFVALPAAAALVTAVLLRRRLHHRLHLFSWCLIRGGTWGFVGTLAYDIVRPLLTFLLGYTFNPYMAIPTFGYYMTGLPVTDPGAIAAGWVYHAWNGVSFGMTFALVRPWGGLLAGLVWGLGLELLMLLTYPEIFQIRLNTPGFVVTGLVGHAVWGIVVGGGLRRGRRPAILDEN